MTPHFSLSEFSCPTVRPDGTVDRKNRETPPLRYVDRLLRVARALEVVRSTIGDKPIRIVSGWRSQAYNSLNKGRATTSQHLYGRAADIRVKGVSPARLYWVIRDLIDAGTIPAGGLAAYPTFTHYDIRGRDRLGRLPSWRPTPARPRSGLGAS